VSAHVPSDIAWVFFDLDGTLADSVPALYEAYLAFMESHGLQGTEDGFVELNGPSIPEIVEILRRKHELAEPYNALLDGYRKVVKEAYRTVARPMDGAEQTCRKLRERGVGLALVTAAERPLAEVFLTARNWPDLFDTVVFGDEVARAKPHPDLYLRALEATGAAAERTVVVEDSPNGVRAARAAGLPVILYQPGPAHRGEMPTDVAATVSRLEDIFDLV